MNRIGSIALGTWASLALMFLYLPVVVLILFSFNDNQLMVLPLKGFTLGWYEAALGNERLLRSAGNSIIVAVVATAIALVVGTAASLALDRIAFPGKALFRFVILMPISLPGVITGVSILNMFSMMGVGLSLVTVILGHTAMLLALVVTQVFARLQRLDRSMEDAAGDLGASPWETFKRVTLPNIRTALIGSGLLSFIVSFDEVAVTFFLTGRENTLPMYIYSSLRQGPSPELNAICTVIFAGTVILIGISVIFLRTGKGATT